MPEVSEERATLVREVQDWGYFSNGPSPHRGIWEHRRVLDIGMGGGPFSVALVEGGAESYVGVDPQVGTTGVRDFRSDRDSSIPAYHAFPYGPADIMRLYPNVKLYSGFLDQVADQVREHQVDIALMSSVTEHLSDPHGVVKTIWETLKRDGLIWFSHSNWYSWTGHHAPPRSVRGWNREDPQQAEVVDWQHLEPTHRLYKNPNFNRMRLNDFKDLISKYFDIIDWSMALDALPRLTPEIRHKYRKYTLEELLGQTVKVTARKRDVPRLIDLSDRQFFHPSEEYLAEADYSNEDLDRYRYYGYVRFGADGKIFSHSDNDYAGLRIFDLLRPGQRIELRKATTHMELTVVRVERPEGAEPRVLVAEEIAEAFRTYNRQDWVIDISKLLPQRG